MTQPTSSRALLWIVAAGFFMQTLDTTIVNTALPSMARTLHERPLAMQPVVVAYALTMAMLTPASGWLADRFGTRQVYFSAILIFVLGSVYCASADTLHQLVIARVLQGIGGSMLLPIGRLAVLRSVSAEQYISALAFISVAGQVGPMLGPTLGGWLAESVSWHWIFLINVPIGIVGLVMVRRALAPRSPGVATVVAPFDFVGCALLSACMVSFSLALDLPIHEHRIMWSSGLMALSALAALAYIPHARARRNPLFRLGLFRNRNFSVGLAGNLVCRIGCAAVPFLLPLLLQVQLGFSPIRSGLMMLPAAIAGSLAKSWVAPLIRRFDYYTFLTVNTLLLGASIVSFAMLAPGWPLLIEIVQLAVFGATNSMQFAAMNAITLKGLVNDDASSGNSLFSMVQMLAISLGVSISGALVSVFARQFGSTGTGFRMAFACVGVVTLLSTPVFRLIQSVGVGVKQAA